jgi:hypothetical protein
MTKILLAIIATTVFCFAGIACAQTWQIETARGTQEIRNKDILAENSMWEGQIKDVRPDDYILFDHWNFNRETPEDVFINCDNIILSDCQTTNVNIPTDGSVQWYGRSPLRRKIVGDQTIIDNLKTGRRVIQTMGLDGEGHDLILSTEQAETPENEKVTIPDDASVRRLTR